jgi:hypothetical protein
MSCIRCFRTTVELRIAEDIRRTTDAVSYQSVYEALGAGCIAEKLLYHRDNQHTAAKRQLAVSSF